MRQLSKTRSLVFFLDEMDYSEAALLAEPDAAHLAPAFTAGIADWDGVFSSERAGRRQVTRANAVVAVRNQQLDRTTSRFAGALEMEAKGRATTLYQRFFSGAPGEFVRLALRKQCEQTRDKLLPELAKLSSPMLRPFVELLDAGFKAALQALDDRGGAAGRRAGTRADVGDWKEGVNRMRTVTYADLLKIAAEKGYKRAWVEAFFRPEGDAQEEDESDTPSAPAAPAPPA
jgi:hypothetical protein